MKKSISIKSLSLKVSLNFFWGLSFILIIFLVILYIFQVTAITEAMYLIKNHSRQLEILSQEKEILEIKFSQLNSLENLRFLVEIGRAHV